MNKVDTICDDCIKKEVCKYKERTEKFKETIEVVNIPSENITINYTCKYKHNGNLFGNIR